MTGDQHKMNSMFCLDIFYLINFLFVRFDFHFIFVWSFTLVLVLRERKSMKLDRYGGGEERL